MAREAMMEMSTKPAPQMMPFTMAQNMNTVSMKSLTAVRKRTMDSAPTMPNESTTLDEMAKMTTEVTKLEEALGVEHARIHQSIHQDDVHAQGKAEAYTKQQMLHADGGKFR